MSMGLTTPYCKQNKMLQIAIAGYNNKWEESVKMSLR
jgi:hypothetical protein